MIVIDKKIFFLHVIMNKLCIEFSLSNGDIFYNNVYCYGMYVMLNSVQ